MVGFSAPMVIPVETVVTRLAGLRIMHQHAAGGNVVDVVDVDFEVVDRGGFGAGTVLSSRGAPSRERSRSLGWSWSARTKARRVSDQNGWFRVVPIGEARPSM